MAGTLTEILTVKTEQGSCYCSSVCLWTSLIYWSSIFTVDYGYVFADC